MNEFTEPTVGPMIFEVVKLLLSLTFIGCMLISISLIIDDMKPREKRK